MPTHRNILVSTTGSLQGHQVEAYLGVASSHIVAGTNLFSDFFASWSDVLGGRSKTYKKQLDTIHQEALTELRKKAIEMNGNAVIGLKVDQSEISGGGKSMLMITVTGTVVKLSKPVGTEELAQFDSISSTGLKDLVERNRIIGAAASWAQEVPNKDWEFIVNHAVHEVTPKLFDILEGLSGMAGSYDTLYKKVKLFLHSLPREKAQGYLYKEYLRRRKIMNDVYKIMRELELFDFERVVGLLQSNRIEERRAGLFLAELPQPGYKAIDIKKLKSLEAGIKKIFVRRAKDVEVTKTFSSKQVKKWECECGHVNASDAQYCSKCHKDQYGFTRNQIKPESVVSSLQSRISALESYFEVAG